jgi:TetR/AcrR family transcriptional repressor of nem operon
MGRTSDARERLLEAVIELIWLGNYGGTSVDQICERAGVKKGSFYHFFASKTALAVAGLEHGWAEHRGKLDRIFSPTVPPIQRILDCFRDFRQEQEELFKKHGRVLGCPIHSLGAEMSTVDEQLRAKLQEILADFMCYYESAIRDAHALGQIHSANPGMLARILFAFSEGLLLHARMWNDLAHLDELEHGALVILGANKTAQTKVLADRVAA